MYLFQHDFKEGTRELDALVDGKLEYVFEFMQKFADERLFESNESLTTICFGDI